MRITFRVNATALDDELGEPADFPDSLIGWKYEGESLEAFLDSQLADKGIVGGLLRVELTDDGAAIAVDYWCHESLPEKTIDLLKEYTTGQLEDGVGENGFEVMADGCAIRLIADTDRGMRFEQVDDGCFVPPPSVIAIAARDGDISKLISVIQNAPSKLNVVHQGHTPLQLAILFGHADAVEVLLHAGADPNRRNHAGDTTLELCVMSNALSDETSAAVAKALLEHGAIRQRMERAIAIAQQRGKHETASVLIKPGS